jgi:hypothetical protein
LSPESLDRDACHWQLVADDLYPRRFVALQESVGQIRGTAPAQIPGAKISVCHGVGGMFAAPGTIIMTNQRP